jgi:hypothetical protein
VSGGGDLASRTILDTFAEHGFEATTTAMRFSRVPTFEEAEMVAQVASGAMDMSKWWLGDLILASESMWGHKYAQLSAITNRSPEGLANIASVAGRVSPDVRRETLSFSHHEAVASLSRERQVYWLDFAEENRLTVHEMRPLVKSEKEAAEKVHDRRELSAGPKAIRTKPVALQHVRAMVAPRSPQTQIERPALREVVAEIVAMPRDDHGRVCLGPNLIERLRAALEAA